MNVSEKKHSPIFIIKAKKINVQKTKQNTTKNRNDDYIHHDTASFTTKLLYCIKTIALFVFSFFFESYPNLLKITFD